MGILSAARAAFCTARHGIDQSTWRATFSRDERFAADGFGADRAPWTAVQLAAWQALKDHA